MPAISSSCTVLVIDDAKFSRDVVAHMLRANGINTILTAADGLEGLEMTMKHKPDIIIADLLMPRMDGYEYCRRVREMPHFKDTPIIIQTAVTEPYKRAEAFEYGATDLLVKPLNADELIARTSVHIEKQNLLKELRGYHERIKQELEQARMMQYDIMPSLSELDDLQQTMPVVISSRFIASEELSGDFWGISKLADKKIAMFLVDFSGHGILAALNTFRLHTLINSDITLQDDPGEYLTKINKVMFDLLPRNQFATMFYGVLDMEEEKLHYASAASTQPYVMAGEEVSMLDIAGLPLSVEQKEIYETVTIPFHKGNVLFCYSDAVTERIRDGVDIYAEDDVKDICHAFIEACKPKIAEQVEKLSEMVEEDVLKDAPDRKLEDDLTMLSIGFTTPC